MKYKVLQSAVHKIWQKFRQKDTVENLTGRDRKTATPQRNDVLIERRKSSQYKACTPRRKPYMSSVNKAKNLTLQTNS